MSTTTFTNKGHAERILQNMWKKCMNKEEFCDVVLIAGTEKQRIPAHRSVLSEASEYLSELFTTSLLGTTSRVVDMSNVNGDILQILIEYCYSGHLDISGDIAVELLKAAHKLLLREVVTACENFLADKLHPSNYLEFMLLAEQYHCELLLQKTKDYGLENFMQITKTNEFLQLNIEQLSQLVVCDDLHVAAEEDVFNSLMTWMQHDPFEREQHKAKLLKLVRLPLLEGSFLIEHVRPICTSIKCLQIYTDALECSLASYINMPSTADNLTKPRRSYQFRMGIRINKSNNKMFVFCYCSQQQKWMKWMKALEYRVSFGVAFIENSVYFVGGKDAKDNILNTTVCVNLKTTAITDISPMIEHREHCLVAALNGFLYAVGGWNGKDFLNSVEKWSPETNKWDKVVSMSVKRANVGVAVLNKKLYVVGGWSEGKPVSAVESYDPVQAVWQDIAPLNEGRQLPGITVANGLLYALGGGKTKTAERYDLQSNKWTLICSLREELFPFPACTTLNKKVVVSFKDCFEEYDSVSNEWKKIESVKHPVIMYQIFSYSGKLVTSQFTDM